MDVCMVCVLSTFIRQCNYAGWFYYCYYNHQYYVNEPLVYCLMSYVSHRPNHRPCFENAIVPFVSFMVFRKNRSIVAVARTLWRIFAAGSFNGVDVQSSDLIEIESFACGWALSESTNDFDIVFICPAVFSNNILLIRIGFINSQDFPSTSRQQFFFILEVC